MGKIKVRKDVLEQMASKLKTLKNENIKPEFAEKLQKSALNSQNEQVTGKLQASKNIFSYGDFDEYKISNEELKNLEDIDKSYSQREFVNGNGKRKSYWRTRTYEGIEGVENNYQKKYKHETEETKMERYLRENSKILTDKNFIDLSKKEVKKLINCLRNSHAYTTEGIKVAYGRLEKNSKKTNEKELKGAKLLRNIGLEIFLLPNRFAVDKNNNERVFGDAIVLNHNHILDFKQVDGKNPGRDWKKATSQGHDVLLYITSEMDIESVKSSIEDFKKHISKKRDNPIITYIYLEKSNEVFRLKYDKEGNLLSQKKKDLNGDRASTTKATVSKSTLSSLNRNRTVEHVYNSTIAQQNNLSSKNFVKSLKPDYDGENKIGQSFDIQITDITENNKQQKLEQFNKALNAIARNQPFMIKHIPADTSTKYENLTVRLLNFDRSKIEKAVHKVAMSLDSEIKAGSKGETFVYHAQEEITDKFFNELTVKTRVIYNFVIGYFDLPDIRIVSKAGELKHKGKILYNPSTGLPIKESDWKKFVAELEKYLNRNYTGIGEKIVLSAESLGIILDRLSKTNSWDAVRKMSLSEMKTKRYDVDWISDSIKNMKDKFGDVISRERQARIQIAVDSAAQRVTRVKDDMRNNIQQIIIDGIRDKQSKSVVAQNLFDKCASLNRDMQRIADTEVQMATSRAYIKEEVYNTPENEKVYFKRFEMLDDNTCKKCRKINGKIVLWSDVALPNEHIKDEFADIAIWEGKTEGDYPESVLHPWCRGAWIRYYPEV